jgi:hypothetical protein
MNDLLKSEKICLDQKNRITKAHYQSFYLLQTEYIEDEVILKVTGSTLNVYTVKIKNNMIKCDCPDKFICYSKKIYCKHICFVICLIGKIYTEDIFINNILLDEYKFLLLFNLRINCENDPNIVSEMLSERFIKLSCKDMSEKVEESIARNLEEDCQICYIGFENKDKSEEEIFTCSECKNAIHKKCFDVWMKYNQNCVFCRKKINIPSTKKESKYLNISRD